MNKKLKKTMYEMWFGLFIFEIVLAILAFFFAKKIGYDIISLELGILVGFVVSILFLWNMATTIEDAVSSKDREYARKKVTIRSTLRIVCVIIIVAVFWRSKYVNVLGIAFSLLGIKLGAYLQPLAHKIFSKEN